MLGVFNTEMSGLGIDWVMGFSRVPKPAERIIPFLILADMEVILSGS